MATKEKRTHKHYTNEEVANALEQIKKRVPKGGTVYTVVRSVAASGMSRRITLLAAVEETRTVNLRIGELSVVTGPAIAELDYWVQTLRDQKHDSDKAGVFIPGCGMDMGFAIVYDLAQALYGDGYALEQRWL